MLQIANSAVPFEVRWTQQQIDQLRERVERCPLPPAPENADWELGCSREFLENFRNYWLHVYDWRAAVNELNRYPQFRVSLDSIDIHFVYVRGESTPARPLILTHGWPGSHYEFWQIADRLTRPSAYGGSTDAAFDVIVPSLPGYGFSGKPVRPVGPRTTAALWNELMTRHLGYDTYLAQGGDWGAMVTAQLGLRHRDSVKAIHLNMPGLRSDLPPQNEEEGNWMRQMESARGRMSGYSALQSMKPMSLALATAGNPLGQAAWILERFHDWSDLRSSDMVAVFGMQRLATNVMIYTMTDSFASSLWFYNGMVREGGINQPPGVRCEVPTGYAAFPGDSLQVTPPRSRIETLFNLVHWNDLPAGGHFAAMEQPHAFVDDLFTWARKVWPS